MSTPKMSERFRAAKNLLESRREVFICHALCRSRKDSDRKAGREIMQRLRPHGTYGEWLRVNHPKLYRSGEYSADMSAPRIVWLDALIAEFEARGD